MKMKTCIGVGVVSMKKTNDYRKIYSHGPLFNICLPNGMSICVPYEMIDEVYDNWKKHASTDLEKYETIKLNQKCPECGGELYQTGDGIWCDTCHYNIFKN